MHDTAPLPARSRFGQWLGLAAFLPLLVWLGWQITTSWFVCDDAFIAFRYARNLADGHGLVFNRGERVEGFTDFLWVLELAGLWRLGVRPDTCPAGCCPAPVRPAAGGRPGRPD